MKQPDTPGATFLGNSRCRFRVWAPAAKKIEVHILEPEEQLLRLKRNRRGYHGKIVDGVRLNSMYFYKIDGSTERPDPASRFQPRGVHGPSRVVDPVYSWDDREWTGIPLSEYVIYELHTGTYTPEGTFDSIIPRLDSLKDVGITAIELMPVAQFPGTRNWGYDGVYPYAVQNSYGGPDSLKKLVNACHKKGMAVILDVVYNHLGPEGNFLRDFGPYFNESYCTPWGPALNFDGPFSDEVRSFFIQNALYWITEFHIDSLRLDALHGIVDRAPRTFIEELAASVHKQGKALKRMVYLMAESNQNDARLISPVETGGFGLDAHWNDDFHHSLRVLLTGDRQGYYKDYTHLAHLAKAFREGFVFSGEYSPFRQRRHGISSKEVPAFRFVVFSQNHDQVGNRMLGERSGQLISFEGLKLAAGAVILSPFIPLLFMGEEYGEKAPFQYFTNHSDPAVVKGTREGRKAEFVDFRWQGEPPDPQDEATLFRSKLNYGLRESGHHRVLLAFYRELLHLRKTLPALAQLDKEKMEVGNYEKAGLLVLHRWSGEDSVRVIFNFGPSATAAVLNISPGKWCKILDSADTRWSGPGTVAPEELTCQGDITLRLQPWSFILLSRRQEG
ncbi:MAG: malto-oligosyltrehalose trehalohydrolase [Dehalococcoidia bacterium]|nr:malto-oligosyltrehalose trehalohydrolase [Dehalococcoidia bacterium]